MNNKNAEIGDLRRSCQNIADEYDDLYEKDVRERELQTQIDELKADNNKLESDAARHKMDVNGIFSMGGQFLLWLKSALRLPMLSDYHADPSDFNPYRQLFEYKP